MDNVIKIPCELMITPGQTTPAGKGPARVKLVALGGVVFDATEDTLADTDLQTSKKIVKTYAERLDAWAGA